MDEELTQAGGGGSGALVPAEDAGLPAPVRAASAEIARMFHEADTIIEEWLDEADQEYQAILERARVQAAQMQVSASERLAEALREADAAASARREAAADEAANLLAESRLQAERHLRAAEQEAEERRQRAERLLREAQEEAEAERRQAAERMRQAEEEAAWRVRQAEADAAAIEAKVQAKVAAMQADVGQLQQQLTELVEHAVGLLPALEATRQLSLDAPAPGDPADDDVVDAELVDEAEEAEPVVAAEPEEAPAEPVHRGLGQLTPGGDDDGEDFADEFDEADPDQSRPRRRGLGRLLGRG